MRKIQKKSKQMGLLLVAVVCLSLVPAFVNAEMVEIYTDENFSLSYDKNKQIYTLEIEVYDEFGILVFSWIGVIPKYRGNVELYYNDVASAYVWKTKGITYVSLNNRVFPYPSATVALPKK